MLFHTGYEPYFEVVRGKVFLNYLIERLKWPAACEANFSEAEGGDTWETLDVDSILTFDGCSIDVLGKSSCGHECRTSPATDPLARRLIPYPCLGRC